MKQRSRWKVGRVAELVSCCGCQRPIYRGDWGYNDPEQRVFCTHCAATKAPLVEKSPQVQAKFDRLQSRLVGFLADVLSRKLK